MKVLKQRINLENCKGYNNIFKNKVDRNKINFLFNCIDNLYDEPCIDEFFDYYQLNIYRIYFNSNKKAIRYLLTVIVF